MPLAPADLSAAIQAYVRHEIPDYQMAAFLMAIYFRGLDHEETRALTLAMRDSGERLVFPEEDRPVVDKHSTGGVGDKVSLVLAPLLACLGFRVPMISGRGLGVTGGTLDKLEAIPGFNPVLSRERLMAQVQSIGCAICSQTESMVPADKGLYALRDATGTIASLPLITASILSKKLAEGLSSLIIDVKWGRAAFMGTVEEARSLAQNMVDLAGSLGVRTRALLTPMDAPTGRAVGNWLEVKEAIQCLQGGGPADLQSLTVELAAHLLVLEARSPGMGQARERARACLASGEPRTRFNQMLAAQGADIAVFESKLRQDSLAPAITVVRADRTGYLSRCDARVIGEVVRELGGGRTSKEAGIDPRVGLDHLGQLGEPVKSGDILCRVHAATEAEGHAALTRLGRAFEMADAPPAASPSVHSVVG